MTRFAAIPSRQLGDKQSEETRRDHASALLELQKFASTMADPSVGPRQYLGRRVFTTSATYAPTRGTRAVLLRMVGGGGGGGGASGGANFAFAGGGWSGLYWEKWISSAAPITGGLVSIGAAGAAGASAATGGTGGDTSAVVNGITYTAKGGAGGLGMANGAAAAVTGIQATSGGSTSGGDINLQERGEQGIRISAGAGWAGSGGNNPLGAGGVTTASGDGGAANVGYGGGGGGGMSAASNQTGGAGGAGCVIVEEFG